ncbi:MAG: DUF4153 domain-containing protein [Arenicella sp.]
MNTIHPKLLISILTLASFCVLSHWNMWTYDVYAFGFNTTIAWLSFIALLKYHNSDFSIHNNWVWLLPISFIVLSFSVYENPWLKSVSTLLLPIAFGIFLAQSERHQQALTTWNYRYIYRLINQAFHPIKFVFPSTQLLFKTTQRVLKTQNSGMLKRITLGITILFPLAAVSIILLSSADKNFSDLIQKLALNVFHVIDIEMVLKAFFVMVLSIIILSTLIAWKKPFSMDSDSEPQTIDHIIAVIVVGGLLMIYSLFLLLQIEYLIVDSLPIDFDKTEHLVKSGFWQLFFLSLLNVVLFTLLYKNTSAIAQFLLTAFIAASGLLLLSAAWRMGLYVFYYGFSYEKFFASYTCLFALVLFVFLVIASVNKTRKDILKVILFSALWCYAIATLLPIEKIILHSNTALAKHEDSRINLVHLKFLSADILNNIQNSHTNSIQTQPSMNGFSIDDNWSTLDWQRWIKQQQHFACSRAWYEKNISLIINCD